MDRFEICHPITAAYEGGWSDHPDDPGGATMFGVTQAVYNVWRKGQGLTTRSVRNISKAEALAIYRKNYWEACGAPKLFPGVDLAVYDASVNSGVSRGRKWLLASIGGSNADTVKKICRSRLSFVQSLAIWKSFGKGWARRIAGIEAKGVSMALQAEGKSPAAIFATVTTESAKAEATAKTTKTLERAVGSGSAAGGGGSALALSETANGIDYTALAVLGAFAAVVIVALIVINVRKRAAAARQEAYAIAAQEIEA